MVRYRFGPRSLLARVMGSVLALLLLGGLLAGFSAWLNGRQAAWQAYDRLLLGAANDIAESIRIVDGAPQPDLPVSAFDLLAQAPDDRVSYAVRGPDGGLLTGYAQAPVRRNSGSDPVFFDASMQTDPARFVQVTRRFSERDFSGVVTVTVGQTEAARQALALSLTRNALLPLGVAGLALLLVAFVVIRSALQPLEALAQNLLRRDPYDLTPIDTSRVPTETAVILHAMNRFMDRLDRQVSSMRTLISDTAHQLRTPVAAIRVQAETITEEKDPATRDRALFRLLRRTRSLGELLDQLLSRALVIHHADSKPRTALDLRDVALDIIEARDHELLSPDAEVALDIGDAPVMVLADAFSLSQAGRNLLSNALKHGAPTVRVGVSVGVSVGGAWAVLWVADAGAGLGDVEQGDLGTRFKTRAQDSGGAGLGLSIVHAVAQAFDGHVEPRRTADGFRIALLLPLHNAGGAQ